MSCKRTKSLHWQFIAFSWLRSPCKKARTVSGKEKLSLRYLDNCKWQGHVPFLCNFERYNFDVKSFLNMNLQIYMQSRILCNPAAKLMNQQRDITPKNL